jgi:SAM-dependent methyltransferase
MHYEIRPGIVVKAENAAKPESQGSTFLKSLLADLPHVYASVDFGCGKLRYCNVILERTDTLAIVDSEIQLSRIQIIIKGVRSTIREAVSRSNRIQVYNHLEFAKSNRHFDRAFCINVLSAVPLISMRRQIMEVIRSHLRPNGTCLYVTQYRNSDFDRMQSMPNARSWRDGFLIDSLRGFSFYGLISPDSLISMAEKAGFAVCHVRRNDGSVYIWAMRK